MPHGVIEMSKDFLRFFLFSAVALLTACDRERERTNVLTARGERELAVMDFSAPFPLDPLPAGWYHRTFWTRGPMEMAFAIKDGVPSLRFETRSTASMLFRHVDLNLANYHFHMTAAGHQVVAARLLAPVEGLPQPSQHHATADH